MAKIRGWRREEYEVSDSEGERRGEQRNVALRYMVEDKDEGSECVLWIRQNPHILSIYLCVSVCVCVCLSVYLSTFLSLSFSHSLLPHNHTAHSIPSHHITTHHNTVLYLHISIHRYHSSHTSGGLRTADVGIPKEKLSAKIALLNVVHVCHIHSASVCVFLSIFVSIFYCTFVYIFR
jgi:hypothetical protein